MSTLARNIRQASLLAAALLLALPGCFTNTAASAQAPVLEPMTARAADGGMQLSNAHEVVQVTFCSPGVVHVVAHPAGASASTSTQAEVQPWIVAPCHGAAAAFTQTAAGVAQVSSADVTVHADLHSGALRFEDASGKLLLQERSDLEPRLYQPIPAQTPVPQATAAQTATTSGEPVYRVSDHFRPTMLEGFYGLGQHQSGVFNYRGSVVELAQANSDIDVPLLLSTNGYGLLWNTASKAMFDNRFAHELTLTANYAGAIDYYFFYGPEMDAVIHRYRDLTGHAPLFGKWAYGFIQSKDRYTSAQQLLDIAAAYRARHLPLDVIVQDWFWWKVQGDPVFSAAYLKPYPDVPGALRKLHAEHVHAIISAWAVMDPQSANYQAMAAQHLLIPGTPDYDPTNPKARDFYWNHFIGKLFAQGWDGFWLDSSEPETWNGESDAMLEDKQLYIGPGARYLNIFPLMHSGNVYDHWRQTDSPKRVFILTRSAFAGQQRYATVEWSGDIFGTFPVLRRQIAAGLNFALSGMPYWTTDIAGYTTPFADAPSNPQYQELYTRWFEFGTFCPILRTHGHRPENELFSYGPQTATLAAYDRLRSRLVPYTYSLAWRVTHDDYTLMRPLVMDWRTDQRVRDIGDQYMFGPALLVNPVTTPGATERLLYLPPAAAWYDLWTGKKLNGGQQILAAAPLDRIPVYVRAGSILPLGPPNEYVDQHPDAPIELRVYPGADGAFTLYNDAGDGYGYEKGQYATVALTWNDATHTLSIGPRQGSYPGMTRRIVFRISVAAPVAGVGSAASPAASTAPGSAASSTFRTAIYTGAPIEVHLP